MERRTRTRRLAALAGGTALAAAALVATASPAQAKGDDHTCGPYWADDGFLNDVIHHTLEPLVPNLHQTSCELQVPLDELSCYVPGLAFLRSTPFASNPFVCRR